MHIPDGFLSLPVAGVSWAVSAVGIGYSVRKTRFELKEKTIPLMGIMAAFVFAAQMLNFPVGAGTSGHLLGGVLTAAFLGPYAGALVLTCVLIVQAVVFKDGGLLTLGANILNMAILGTMFGYIIYRGIFRLTRRIGLSVGIAGWLSVVLGASLCAAELAASKTAPARFVFPAMAGVHALIGIGEGVITTFVVGFVLKIRPDLIYTAGSPAWSVRERKKAFAIAGAAVFVLALCAPFASRFPDGLEKVADALGFLNREMMSRTAPLADYGWPGIGNEKTAAILAALTGTVLVAGTALLVARITRKNG